VTETCQCANAWKSRSTRGGGSFVRRAGVLGVSIRGGCTCLGGTCPGGCLSGHRCHQSAVSGRTCCCSLPKRLLSATTTSSSSAVYWRCQYTSPRLGVQPVGLLQCYHPMACLKGRCVVYSTSITPPRDWCAAPCSHHADTAAIALAAVRQSSPIQGQRVRIAFAFLSAVSYW